MAEYIQVTERYWSVCWKWGVIPYPCRKTRTVMKWHYHFDFLNVSYRYVYTNYWGCELNRKYQWRWWEFTLRGEDLTFYGYDMFFKNKLTDSGECIPPIDPPPIE